MHIVSTIARYLLGLIFTLFGLNGFFHFMPDPPPVSVLGIQYFQAISASHYIAAVFLLQVVGGLLLLAGRFVPLALTVLAGIIFNILVYHVTMDPKGVGPGLLVTVLWLLVFVGYRASFRGLLSAAPERSA